MIVRTREQIANDPQPGDAVERIWFTGGGLRCVSHEVVRAVLSPTLLVLEYGGITTTGVYGPTSPVPEQRGAWRGRMLGDGFGWQPVDTPAWATTGPYTPDYLRLLMFCFSDAMRAELNRLMDGGTTWQPALLEVA